MRRRARLNEDELQHALARPPMRAAAGPSAIDDIALRSVLGAGSPGRVRPPAPSDLIGLQGLAGNRALGQLLGGSRVAVQRHSEAEAAQGKQADDEGNEATEEDPAVVQRQVAAGAVVQREKTRDISADKAAFDAHYANNKDVAVNFLKRKYGLDSKPYTLSVAQLGSASTHALTGGGWNRASSAFTPITVRVNEPYLDRQVQSQDTFTKLVHTLGHEYQHVKQRSQKDWRTTDDDSAKGEREFLAYSWEILEASSKKGMAPLESPQMVATIDRAITMYGEMDAALQQKHDRTYQKLLTVKMQNTRRFFA